MSTITAIIVALSLCAAPKVPEASPAPEVEQAQARVEHAKAELAESREALKALKAKDRAAKKLVREQGKAKRAAMREEINAVKAKYATQEE